MNESLPIPEIDQTTIDRLFNDYYILVLPTEINSLCPRDQDFLHATLQKFVDFATKKYAKGQLEHGGWLADRDCHKEMQGEIIDFLFYWAAEDYKKELQKDNGK